MSDYHNARTEETVEEESTIPNNDRQEKDGSENPSMNMHLQLTIDGDDENKEIMKDFKTQESPHDKGSEEFDKFREYKTQESPVSKNNKDSVDWKGHRTEEDQNQGYVEGSVTGPSEFIGCKTIDDDLKPSADDHRIMKTVEEEDDSYEPYQAYPVIKVIWKLLNVRPHAKNTEPFSKMIHLLPAESIVKCIGEWTLFGRGENVDVYLHDLLSSRKHADFTITKDNRRRDSQRFIATIRNKSETKKIKVNGNREMHPGDVYELHNNDQISIGVFTFLIEIVPGDSRSKKYELKFLNILPSAMESQSYLSSLYALPPSMQIPSLGVQPGMAPLDMHERMAAFQSFQPAPSAVPFPSPRISSPSWNPSNQPRLHRQPVENTDDEQQRNRPAQENDEGCCKSEDEFSIGKKR